MQNKGFSKYGAGLIILAVVFLVGFIAGKEYKVTDKPQSVERDLKTASASIMIDYGNGKITAYNDIEVVATSTAFDVLQSAAGKDKINLGFKDYGGELGIFIETIGGVGKDPSGKKWWQFWVNNSYSKVGASSYNVKPGDVIEFKFVEGQV